MKHSIHCNVCNQTAIVNGQKQIHQYAILHAHPSLSTTQLLTGSYLDLDNPVDRVTLKIDRKPLTTHC